MPSGIQRRHEDMGRPSFPLKTPFPMHNEAEVVGVICDYRGILECAVFQGSEV